jgi:hypothetical protein
MMPDRNKWRIGRSLGRTIYEQRGPEATKDDVYLGMMETEAIARFVVDLYNDWRTRIDKIKDGYSEEVKNV